MTEAKDTTEVKETESQIRYKSMRNGRKRFYAMYLYNTKLICV